MNRQPDSGQWERDWVISPGETLKDWIEENGLTPRTTATTCRLDPKVVEGILSGKRAITKKIAASLHSGTGISARLWLNLERAYREGLAAGKIDASGT